MAGKSRQPSHHAEGKKGTSHTDVVYTVQKREGGGGGNPETILVGRMALQQTRGIHAHVDKRRPLNAQADQRWPHAWTGAGI